MDPTDPDPQHCFFSILPVPSYIQSYLVDLFILSHVADFFRLFCILSTWRILHPILPSGFLGIRLCLVLLILLLSCCQHPNLCRPTCPELSYASWESATFMIHGWGSKFTHPDSELVGRQGCNVGPGSGIMREKKFKYSVKTGSKICFLFYAFVARD